LNFNVLQNEKMKNIVISIQNSQKRRFWGKNNRKAMGTGVRSQESGVSGWRKPNSQIPKFSNFQISKFSNNSSCQNFLTFAQNVVIWVWHGLCQSGNDNEKWIFCTKLKTKL